MMLENWEEMLTGGSIKANLEKYGELKCRICKIGKSSC